MKVLEMFHRDFAPCWFDKVDQFLQIFVSRDGLVLRLRRSTSSQRCSTELSARSWNKHGFLSCSCIHLEMMNALSHSHEEVHPDNNNAVVHCGTPVTLRDPNIGQENTPLLTPPDTLDLTQDSCVSC